MEARSREHALDRHPLAAPHETPPDLDFQLVGGREGDVPALGGHDHLAAPVSRQARDAEAGARTQDGHRLVLQAGDLGTQHAQRALAQARRAQGLGGEVVEQARGLESADTLQPGLGDLPVEIGEVHGPVCHRTRHRQHHRRRPLGARLVQIGLDGRFRRGIAGGGIGLGLADPRPSRGVLHQGEPGIGAADVADQAQHLRRTAPRRRGRRRRRSGASSRTARGRSRSSAPAGGRVRGPSVRPARP